MRQLSYLYHIAVDRQAVLDISTPQCYNFCMDKIHNKSRKRFAAAALAAAAALLAGCGGSVSKQDGSGGNSSAADSGAESGSIVSASSAADEESRVIALAIALALTRKGLKGTNAFRTVFFMPNLIGGIVLGYIWQILINAVLSSVGAQLLSLNTTAGFWGMIVLTLWQQVGYMMIIYIAGLQSIPSDYLEAAKVDGANAWQTLWKVKIPNLMSTITICLFLSLTNGFKLFDQNLALTGGDPDHMSEMLALNIYNTFYSRVGAKWMGIGQAKAVIFCILVVCISLVQLKITRSKEVQQ